jgi:hypothetical protein
MLLCLFQNGAVAVGVFTSPFEPLTRRTELIMLLNPQSQRERHDRCL